MRHYTVNPHMYVKPHRLCEPAADVDTAPLLRESNYLSLLDSFRSFTKGFNNSWHSVTAFLMEEEIERKNIYISGHFVQLLGWTKFPRQRLRNISVH